MNATLPSVISVYAVLSPSKSIKVLIINKIPPASNTNVTISFAFTGFTSAFTRTFVYGPAQDTAGASMIGPFNVTLGPANTLSVAPYSITVLQLNASNSTGLLNNTNTNTRLGSYTTVSVLANGYLSTKFQDWSYQNRPTYGSTTVLFNSTQATTRFTGTYNDGFFVSFFYSNPYLYPVPEIFQLTTLQ